MSREIELVVITFGSREGDSPKIDLAIGGMALLQRKRAGQ